MYEFITCLPTCSAGCGQEPHLFTAVSPVPHESWHIVHVPLLIKGCVIGAGRTRRVNKGPVGGKDIAGAGATTRNSYDLMWFEELSLAKEEVEGFVLG